MDAITALLEIEKIIGDHPVEVNLIDQGNKVDGYFVLHNVLQKHPKLLTKAEFLQNEIDTLVINSIRSMKSELETELENLNN